MALVDDDDDDDDDDDYLTTTMTTRLNKDFPKWVQIALPSGKLT